MKNYIYEMNKERQIELSKGDGFYRIKDSIDTGIYQDYFMIYSDDYGFSAYTDNLYETDELTFDITPLHPLYYPFLNFLKGENSVKFSSDFRREEYDELSYIEISKNEEIITLKFVNRIKEEQESFEKFNFEIKNIFFDLRSKLDANNTDIKDRLHRFFIESVAILKCEYHQISIDEYMYTLKQK